MHIGGYVVPLDFEATNVKEFLLVPFVGRLHPRAAAAAEPDRLREERQGLRRAGLVRSRLRHRHAQGRIAIYGLAETGYSIDAEKVETRKE